jgi:hypothetical protein
MLLYGATRKKKKNINKICFADGKVINSKVYVAHISQITWEQQEPKCTTTLQVGSKNLIFTRAKYGACSKFIDVLKIIKTWQTSVEKNGILCVNNRTMKGDPTPNVEKTLKISYTIDDISFTLEIKEGDGLEIIRVFKH